MQPLSLASLHQYWSTALVEANVLVVLNLLGALFLGMLVGYERSYHGRAAGMRTYGLVCMASAALTVVVGFPEFWYGGHTAHLPADPTRVIQGVVTGIGFLGAGVIMKDGLSISGLTTAASIWAASCIGVLTGMGFYSAAILMSLVCAISMSWVKRLEDWLPARTTLMVTLKFRQDFQPREDVLVRVAQERGYKVATDSMSISYEGGQPEWRFSAVAVDKTKGTTPAELAHELSNFDGVVSFNITHIRA